MLWESALGLLRKDETAVRDHVVLALRALVRGGVESVLSQLGRETRGPSVVSASDGAVEDLDLHHESLSPGMRPPTTGVDSRGMEHAVALVVTDDLRRSRLTFRARGAAMVLRVQPRKEVGYRRQS